MSKIIPQAERAAIDLEELFCAKGDKAYVLKVRGDSMIEYHLCDGDYVIVERGRTARDGDTVVALLETGEATIRRYSDGDGARLQIQGVVIGVLRSFR